jgi:hypothetical protein
MFSQLKWRLVFSFILFSVFAVQGQSIARSAIGAAGVSLHDGDATVQSIAGQSSLTINRQGFIQPQQSELIKPTRSVSIAPNPTTAVSYLAGVAKGDIIQVSTLTGRYITSIKATSFTRQEIDLEDLPNGIYLITITGVFEYNTIKLVKAN